MARNQITKEQLAEDIVLFKLEYGVTPDYETIYETHGKDFDTLQLAHYKEWKVTTKLGNTIYVGVTEFEDTGEFYQINDYSLQEYFEEDESEMIESVISLFE